MLKQARPVVLLVFVLFCFLTLQVEAQIPFGNAFTYQGQLRLKGTPVTEPCDFEFRLFGSEMGGVQIGPTVAVPKVNVTAGLFTVKLDFGTRSLDGRARWLEVSVRCPAGSGFFVMLLPRQALTPVPHASVSRLALDAGLLDGLDSSAFAVSGHVHSGEQIVSGIVAESVIDSLLTRDAELLPLLRAMDGRGSGLDADFLDGIDASAFASSAHSHSGKDITSGTISQKVIDSAITRDDEVLDLLLDEDGPGSDLDADVLDGLNSTAFARSAHSHSGKDITSGIIAEGVIHSVITRDFEVLSILLGVDGSGSGLDADLVDGIQGPFVDLGTDQSIGGEKTFQQRILAPQGFTAEVLGAGPAVEALAIGNINALFAQSDTAFTPTVLAQNDNANGFALFTNGNLGVSGDAFFMGAKSGYVTDVVINGGEDDLHPGDLVEIMGSHPAVIGDIPTIIVRKTSEASSHRVLGPIACALAVTAQDETSEDELVQTAFSVHRVDGAMAPGEYGMVVTLGSFARIRVDAQYGVIYPGDLLVSSPTLGHAMVAARPTVGTVVGKALGSLESGTGEMPVFISPR